MFMLNYIWRCIKQHIINVVHKKFPCISHILHLTHFICDKSMQTLREHHCREQKVSSFNSALASWALDFLTACVCSLSVAMHVVL